MRWVTFRRDGSGDDRVGVVEDGRVHALEPGVSLLGLLGDDGDRLRAAGERARRDPDDVVDLGDVTLRAPVPEPPSLRDFLAFEEHLANARKATGMAVDDDWYQLPIFYFSNPAAVVGPNDDVAVPPGCEAWDYELEVGCVVGGEGANLSPEQAEQHIAGYTIFCDFSARDLQMREMKLGLGPAKGKDSATTLGPMLVTPDELEPFRSGNAYHLAMSASVNGTRQGGGWLDDIYWSFPEMLSYASRGTRLRPGDVFGSGTVGTGCLLELGLVHGQDAYPWLRPGDLVELEVEQIGRISHRIVEGPPKLPLRADRPA